MRYGYVVREETEPPDDDSGYECVLDPGHVVDYPLVTNMDDLLSDLEAYQDMMSRYWATQSRAQGAFYNFIMSLPNPTHAAVG